MTQMKRSPSSSCSSSSSCVESDVAHQSETPKTKRARKSRKQEKCENGNSPSSGRRSSVYRGVTRHRWTGRFEAHLWDKSSWNNIQNKKGRQVYLGAYDNEEAAAHTYDLAALKYWGPGTTLNFPIETYTKELEEMEKATREEYLASLRRRSSGFSRGVSKYRGVARHHHNGRWEARIGRVFGNKYLYLGTYNTQEEAAAAYDMAAIEYRGANAVTNFDISHYIDRLKEKTPGFDTHTLSQPAAFPTTCTPLEVEVEVEQQPLLQQQPQPQPQQQQPQQQPQMVVDQTHHTQVVDPTCIDASATVVLDPGNEQDPWSFLDSGFFSLPVPDFPLEKPCEITDLFDHIGFEEDIDFLFETACMNQEGANLTGIFDDAGFGGEVIGVSGRTEQGEDGQDMDMDRLLSSSTYSSSSSTTTSVSCMYTG